MTTLAIARAPMVTSAGRQLGGVEARRMVRHPAYPIGLVYVAVFLVAALTGDDVAPWANTAYITVFLCLFLIYAPVTIIVANRIAAATYRRRVREVLDGTPVQSRERTVGVMLGLLRGPVLVGLAGAAVLFLLQQFTSTDVAANNRVVPRVGWDYLQLPVLVLGAGLLGIAVARWLPWPGVMPVVVLIVWIGTVAMYAYTAGTVAPTRAWFALWPVWVASQDGLLPQQPLDREMWHLVYLLGLGCLAGIAALLRTDGPRRGLWIAATGTAVLTGLAAWLQLG
jgi:hypothetical protein